MPLKMIRPGLRTLDTRKLKVPERTWSHRKVTEPNMAFYSSPEWRKLRDRLLKERGRTCQDCGRTGTRIYCDHVVELQDGGDGLDEANVRLRCGSCHTRKTADARARRLGLR